MGGAIFPPFDQLQRGMMFSGANDFNRDRKLSMNFGGFT
jgi:hypothetical protein